MKILDTENGTMVELGKTLSSGEKDLLIKCLSLFELEIKESERKEQLEGLFNEMKKGRADRFLKSIKSELADH